MQVLTFHFKNFLTPFHFSLRSLCSLRSLTHCIEHGYPTIVGARRFPLTIHWLDDMATMNIGGGGGGLEPNGHATPTTTLPSRAVQEAKALCRQRVNVHAPVSQQYTKVEGNRFMFGWRHLFHVLTCFFFVLSTIVSLFKVSLAFDIARHVGTPGRSVLIFVSGIAQITDFVDRFNEIKERGRGRNHYVVIPIHSDIPFHEQMLAFDQAVLEEEVGSGEEGETKSHQPVPRKRTLPIKIVVATNAAESSITLPDCDHVICLGTAKRGTKMLEMLVEGCWIKVRTEFVQLTLALLLFVCGSWCVVSMLWGAPLLWGSFLGCPHPAHSGVQPQVPPHPTGASFHFQSRLRPTSRAHGSSAAWHGVAVVFQTDREGHG